MRFEDDGIPFEWMNLKETGRYLNLSEPTLRRMLRRGRLPGAVKIGGLWRFHRATLDASLLGERGKEEPRGWER